MAARTTTREIRVLSPSVVNKIAAGEVIERPASVVKELMENAVDAGSTRIDVTIEKGGVDLIRVADDGCGMRADQLPLSVTSHATSKIQSADDLFEVGSLGFRGEALASISEISHFIIRSRTHDSDAGHELEINGGQAGEPVPCGAPPGTTIEVRNLFFNTPVRRRYLRTPQTESGHISEAFTRIALAYPNVHFRLAHNGKTVHDLPQADNWRDRIGHFFGADIRSSLIPVQSEDGEVRLSGYVVDPSHSRAHNRMQYLFLNGRTIRDRALQHALGEAYRGLLMTGRFPIAFLKLEMPPALVDVNVHPCKLEVRLQEGGRMYSQLLSAVRNQFLSTDLTAQVDRQSARGSAPGAALAPNAGAALNRESGVAENEAAVGRGTIRVDDADQFQRQRNEINAWAEQQVRTSPSADQSARTTSGESSRQMSIPLPNPLSDAGSSIGWGRSAAEARGPLQGGESQGFTTPGAIDQGTDEQASDAGGTFDVSHSSRSEMVGQTPQYQAVQIQNRYLVCENDQGMVVIDQHALHERILYEEIREKVLSGKPESQRLLVPEPVTLTPAEAATVLDCRETLSKIGIEVEPFGGETVLITAYPAMLAKRPPAEILRQLVEELLVEGKTPDRRDVLDELLHLISCKAAIKAGDRLSGAEISALLEHRELCQDAHHCPHGRPTSLVFSREELDRRFKRI